MTANTLLVWIGLAGIEPDDNARARLWEQRLHGAMVGIALLALPAYVLDTAVQRDQWHRLATVLDALILAAFLAESAWMASVSSFPVRYLFGNWLNLVVVAGSAAALFGTTTEWIALVRVARVAVAGIMLVRVVTRFRFLLTRRGAPALVGVAFLTMLATGGIYYWLDPSISSFWDGLWLAFVSGTTVGYGDIVPTTGASRLVTVFVVLAGWALLSLFTANIVAMFVGRDERELRADLHREIVHLRREIAQLVDDEEIRFRQDLHRDVNQLRRSITQLIDAEELAFRTEFRKDIEALGREIATLRAEIAQRDAGRAGRANAPHGERPR